MYLNDTKKNILLISCLSSPADADTCMCLLVELWRQKEWKFWYIFLSFLFEFILVHMCWARLEEKPKGYSSLHLPVSIFWRGCCQTDFQTWCRRSRIVLLTFSLLDCRVWGQRFPRCVSVLCCWVLNTSQPQRVLLYLVPSKSDPSSNLHQTIKATTWNNPQSHSPSLGLGGISFLVYTVRQGSAATQIQGELGLWASPQPLQAQAFMELFNGVQ